jgi:hypothetical protein
MRKIHKVGLAAAGTAAAAGAAFLAFGGGHEAPKPVERHQMRNSPNPKPSMPSLVGEKQKNMIAGVNWAVNAAARCMLNDTVQASMHVEGNNTLTNAGATAGPDGKKGTADDIPLITMGRGRPGSGLLNYSIKFGDKEVKTTVVANPDESAFKGEPDTHTMLNASYNARGSGWSLEVSEGRNTTRVTRGPGDTMTEWKISHNHAAPHKATDEEIQQLQVSAMTALGEAVIHSGNMACRAEDVIVPPDVTLPTNLPTVHPSASGSVQSHAPSTKAPASAIPWSTS